jgi:hypothetical protein
VDSFDEALQEVCQKWKNGDEVEFCWFLVEIRVELNVFGWILNQC